MEVARPDQELIGGSGGGPRTRASRNHALVGLSRGPGGPPRTSETGSISSPPRKVLGCADTADRSAAGCTRSPAARRLGYRASRGRHWCAMSCTNG